MTMKIDQYHMGDKSGGEPESGFHHPLKSRRHIPIIQHAICVPRIGILSL
jgi:hypothetical protein